jgi:CysZ protein
MNNITGAFFEAFKIWRQDKWVLLFSLIPIFLGFLVYALVGNLIYTDLMAYLKTSLMSYFDQSGYASFVYYIVVTLVTVVLFFAVNWGFVLVVSVIAGPFNDLISTRVERTVLKLEQEEIQSSIKNMLKKLVATILNEIKKVSLVVLLTIFALVLNFIPLLSPVSFILSAILMSVTFLDYSWGRRGLTFKECVADVKKSFWSYGLSGAGFLLLFSVPLLNIFVLPFAVIYFTVLWSRRQVS